jgi:hypothetical protein
VYSGVQRNQTINGGVALDIFTFTWASSMTETTASSQTIAWPGSNLAVTSYLTDSCIPVSTAARDYYHARYMGTWTTDNGASGTFDGACQYIPIDEYD